MGSILIVDDDPDILDSMTALLASLGHATMCASDADAALVAAAEHAPDLILHDLRMPGLNLSGMVASLRSHPATATTPLIFFSAHPDVADAAAKYDAWGYLRKPFAEPELIALIEGALGHAPRRSDAREDVQELFHDFWNTLSAMAITTRLLQQGPGDGRAAKRLDDLLLILESKTDRLRSSVLAAMGEPAKQARPR